MAKIGAEKQECRVLEAVLEGGETSDQISSMVGLPLNIVSAYLSVFCGDGLIVLKIRAARRLGYRGTVYECLWSPRRLTVAKIGPEAALQVMVNKFVRAHVQMPHFFTGIDRAQQSGAFTHARQKNRGILAGVPDTLLIYPGLPPILIELKAKGRKVEADSLQERVGEAIEAAGGHWAWCDTVQGYAAILHDLQVPLLGRWDLAAASHDATLEGAAGKVQAVRKPRAARKQPRYTMSKSGVARARRSGILI